MAKAGRTVGERIARCLADARPPGLPRRVTASQVRAWAREFLADPDAEPGAARWNLWMDDGGDQAGPGHFAVALFWPRPRGLEFFSGVGISLAVQTFSVDEQPDDPSGMYEAMAGRFVVGRLLRVSRAAAEQWLGRGW